MFQQVSNLSSRQQTVHQPVALGEHANRPSEVILRDSDCNSIVSEDLAYGGSELNLSQAQVNVESSSDFIIGPVTQYHGPVTIYQNVNAPLPIGDNDLSRQTNCDNKQNGKLVKSESTASDHSPTAPLQRLLQSKRRKLFALLLVLLVFAALAVVSGVFLVQQPVGAPDSPTTRPEVFPGPGALIYRDQWGGRPPRNFTRPLSHPTPLVIISHTAGKFCGTLEACATIVRSIQDYHVSHFNSPDVGYNFLVGGDGNIYVGRGWDTVNFHDDGTIGISFIGNFVYDDVVQAMSESVLSLLKMGVEEGKLAEDYVLVAHNQTYATQSPGGHVYEVIKAWPHLSTKIIPENNK